MTPLRALPAYTARANCTSARLPAYTAGAQSTSLCTYNVHYTFTVSVRLLTVYTAREQSPEKFNKSVHRIDTVHFCVHIQFTLLVQFYFSTLFCN